MVRKNYMLNKPKILPVYLLVLVLALWRVGNVCYSELYNDYGHSQYIIWQQVAYIALFISLLMFFRPRKATIKFLVWITLLVEVLISLLQVFRLGDPLGSYVGWHDQLNLTFVVGSLVFLVIFEAKAYLKRQKYLRLTIKQVDHAKNYKIGYR